MRELYPDFDAPLGIDLYGDEFPNPFQPYKAPPAKSPLMSDVPGADTSTWSSAPRPTVTAWQGADLDAFWLDGATWRHCQTGQEWKQ